MTQDDRKENPTSHEGLEEMQKAIADRKRRIALWEKEGERSIWNNLSMIGALGWLIVVPILLGAFVGRWLDRLFDTGVFFSGSLIFLGAGLGGVMIWKRMNEK